MSAKVVVSLKIKILTLTIILLAVALGTYLFVALDMFEQDKQAYVSETNLSTAESLAEQVSYLVDSTFKTSYALGVLAKTDPDSLQRMIDLDPNLLVYAVFKQGENDKYLELERNFNKKVKINNETFFQTLKNITDEELMGSGRVQNRDMVLFNSTEMLGVPSFILVVNNKKDKELYSSVVDLDHLKNQFTRDNVYQNSLWDESGNAFIQTTETTAQTKTDSTESMTLKFAPAEKYIEDLLGGVSKRGAIEGKNYKGEQKMIAYVKNPQYQFMVTSEISKSKVFAANQLLVKKSSFFGLMLLSLAIFFGALVAISLTRPIDLLVKATQGVSEGDFNRKVIVKSSDEMNVLAESFNLMTDEIRKLLDKAVKQTADKARITNELETAQTVQKTLFPAANSMLDNIEVSGQFKSAKECSGDWWHYTLVGDRLFLWVAEAAASGVPAALMIAACRSASAIVEKVGGITPAKALAFINHALYETGKGKIPVKLFLGIYDIKTRKLIYGNAGHTPPIAFKFDKTIAIEHLIPLDQQTDTKLGKQKSVEFQEHAVQMEPNYGIAFFTEGTLNLKDEKNTPFGKKAFVSSLIKGVKTSNKARDIIPSITKDLEAHKGAAEQSNDISFYITKFN